MMPDLGRYATEVLSAYGVSLLLLAGITGLSWRRFRRVREEMEQAERGRHG
jgi:heme exporter protein D